MIKIEHSTSEEAETSEDKLYYLNFLLTEIYKIGK